MRALYAVDALPEGGGSLLDLLGNPAISTPAGFALAVLFYLAKLYRDKRSADRDDRIERKENESHIVDETRDILAIRREEAAIMAKQAASDRRRVAGMEIRIREMDDTIADLIRRNRNLMEENERLRQTDRTGS